MQFSYIDPNDKQRKLVPSRLSPAKAQFFASNGLKADAEVLISSAHPEESQVFILCTYIVLFSDAFWAELMKPDVIYRHLHHVFIYVTALCSNR